MSAIERIRKAHAAQMEVRANEIAKATGKTVKEAYALMEIENEINAEHERLTGTNAAYVR